MISAAPAGQQPTSSRTKRVIVYTISLLTAPLPVMFFEKGTREFAIALIGCGTILGLSSLYVAAGERRLRHRSLLGNKLLATSVITLLFAAVLVIGSIIFLACSRLCDLCETLGALCG